MVSEIPYIQFAFTNNGDEIDIEQRTTQAYTKLTGRSGFGVAPTQLTLLDGSGDGQRWRNTKRSSRQILFPLAISGDNRQDIEDKMRRLIRLFNDKYDTPTLSATYPDGSIWQIDFHFAGGADPVFGQDTDGNHYAVWNLQLTCPDPYWVSLDAEQYSLRNPVVGKGLIRAGNGGLTKLQLSSSQAIGTFTVVNSGDVEVYPIWNVLGPGDSFTAVRQIDGATLAYNAPIIAGNSIIADARSKTVVDQAGANKYGSLGTAPKFFSIPVGTSQITVSLANSTSASLITMFFLEKRELVF